MGPHATSAVTVGVILFVLGVGSRIQAVIAQRDVLPVWVGRKVAHVGFGASVLYSWTIFPDFTWARWYALAPAAAVAGYFTVLGLGWAEDAGTVKAGSRSGERSGLLRGPIYYCATFAVVTALFWRGSPIGMAALAVLTFGDGAAEPFGRLLRSPKLPWSPEKSVAGSMAAAVFGWLGGVAGVWLLVAGGFVGGPVQIYVAPLCVVAFVGAVVESLPFAEVDNFTVAAASVGVGLVVF